MIKRLLVAACLCLSFLAVAQEGTASPYSAYGLGEFRWKGTAENRAMGGLSVMPDSIHLNITNPAMYSNLKLVTLTAGATYSTTGLKTNDGEENSRRTALDYLAVGIPMGKLSAGFGLMPYTSVGYKIQFTAADTSYTNRFTGNGGLNKAFLGASYKLTKNFSVGAEFGYYFGKFETMSLFRQLKPSTQYGTRELNESSGSGAGFNFGASYQGMINKKLSFAASATFSPEGTVRFDNSRRIAVVEFINEDAIRENDGIDVDVRDTDVVMPAKYSLGASLGENKKWMVGAELTFMQSENMTNRFAEVSRAGFENAIKYNIGGYYIPNHASFTSYAERIVYRAGLKHETTGLVLNGKSITDTGFSLGLGLPITGTFSNINLGLEYGKRGTRDAMLVEENYINVSLGFSFNDRWFVKRRYD